MGRRQLSLAFLVSGRPAMIRMLLAVPPTNVPSNIMMLSTLIKFPLVFISGIFVPLGLLPPHVLCRTGPVFLHRRTISRVD